MYKGKKGWVLSGMVETEGNIQYQNHVFELKGKEDIKDQVYLHEKQLFFYRYSLHNYLNSFGGLFF